MNHIQLRLLCQSCSDKRKVRQAESDAKRIVFRLTKLIGHRLELDQSSERYSQYFHSAVHCRMSGSICNQMAVDERKLRIAEEELDRVFSSFMSHLETLEIDQAIVLQRKAFDLLRGHYPQAARIMQH